MTKPKRPNVGKPPQWMNGGPLAYYPHYSMTLPLGLCEARQVALIPTANGYRYHHCAAKCKGLDKRKATTEEATKYIRAKQALLKEYSVKPILDNSEAVSHIDISSDNVVDLHR